MDKTDKADKMDKADKILARYFSGEATEQELRTLDNWIAESEENEKYFMEMTQLFQKISPKTQHDFNAEKALSNFKKHIYQDIPILQAKKKDKIRIKYWAAAAIILLITIFSLFITNQNKKEITILADNQTKEIVFSENINIVLNQNSSLEYQKNDLNKAILIGEATFNINSKDNQDFTVYAGNTIIKDIGTIFTVTAHENEDIVSVNVVEGEVIFYTEENIGINIKENEIGVYYELENRFELIPRHIEQLNNHDIVFHAQELKVVVTILQKIFDVEIIIEDKSLENIPLTAHFDNDESLELILNIIAETLSVNVVKVGNVYKIN
ncbi:FecR family protein [Bacteroidales bacterium OttesenSCG-928-K03]|nr:FecR family protein [Odoribacter sp. OttesenSCG-928-L07]MDL2239253.1 FecR family protein [Bacteroidales bacterium OttesenSCG-928-L14]MDL2240406.1 FecR family protein [Bacteroidales bacterium OttesenSCG-928-K22]MDL2242381.1 FecR family protein [Bacteroidales bacterium OttesenSCG-928-K03]